LSNVSSLINEHRAWFDFDKNRNNKQKQGIFRHLFLGDRKLLKVTGVVFIRRVLTCRVKQRQSYMINRILVFSGLLVLLVGVNFAARAQAPCDKICGRWESAEKNIIVDVYRDTGKIKAKVVWFDAGSDKLMKEWLDKNNPDIKLQKRRLLGMNILSGLIYTPAGNSWENGMIYDAKHGRYWNAAVFIDKYGSLKVKGYWHFKFIGRTMTFNRLLNQTAL